MKFFFHQKRFSCKVITYARHPPFLDPVKLLRIEHLCIEKLHVLFRKTNIPSICPSTLFSQDTINSMFSEDFLNWRLPQYADLSTVFR